MRDLRHELMFDKILSTPLLFNKNWPSFLHPKMQEVLIGKSNSEKEIE